MWTKSTDMVAVGLHLSSLRKKERVTDRHQWRNGWGTLQVWSKIPQQHLAVCRRRWAEHGGYLPSQGVGHCQLWGNWHLVGSLVTRETRRGVSPLTASLMRTITSWDLGQACWKVSVCKIERWSNHWFGRRCTESKRTAILRAWPYCGKYREHYIISAYKIMF